MKLDEIFTQLSSNEFSKLSIGGEEQGVINEKNWDKIIPQVQLGLTALYTRFNLKEGQVVIELSPGVESYTISSAGARSNKRNKLGPFVVRDSEHDKFKDDILKIKSVTNMYGHDYPLNDSTEKYSLGTTSTNVLYVPKQIKEGAPELIEDAITDTLFIKYWANHPKIVRNLGYFEPCNVDIELPTAYLEPLLYYIASRVHNPVGMVNEFNAGNNYAAKYEQSCARLEERNLDMDDFGRNSRFRRNGWV